MTRGFDDGVLGWRLNLEMGIGGVFVRMETPHDEEPIIFGPFEGMGKANEFGKTLERDIQTALDHAASRFAYPAEPRKK